jgi:Protein of unknown function (DUF2844)
MKLPVPHRRQMCRLSPRLGEQSSSPVDLLNAGKRRRSGCATPARWKPRFEWLSVGAVGLLLLAISLPARASLGANVSSVESDRARMNASAKAMQHDGYEVREMEAPGGTVVDEYVSPAGTVFAVTWHGQFPPPMQQLLGSYFQQYTAALEAQPKTYGHRPLNIQEPGLVVETGGHMRAHFGRAYIPDLLPQGLTVTQIQ